MGMEPARSYSESPKEYEVILDGESVELERNQRKHLVSENGKVVYTIFRSADDVLELETPHTRIIYNGKTIEVEPLNSMMHTQCGLCGNNDNNKMVELQTAKSCIASLPSRLPSPTASNRPALPPLPSRLGSR